MMAPPHISNLLNPQVVAQADEIGHTFVHAQPFPHVVIDHFFAEKYADSIVSEFPAFEDGNHIGDDGKPGEKSTNDRICRLGPAFVKLDEMIQSPTFLQLLGRMTHIPELLYDPFYLGGGTHENRHGASLDTHVDFNYHPSERWHRRLNLIVYLNRGWASEWGGALELYRDPHTSNSPDVVISPVFNRCVIFETSERSWHGFSRIQLPLHSKQLTRKSVALYFYSRNRPKNEIADRHSTIYVKKALPSFVQPGYTLTAEDVAELNALLIERDQHIKLQYEENTKLLRAQDGGLSGKLLYLLKRAYVRYRR